MKKNVRSIALYFVLAVILFAGLWAALHMARLPETAGSYVDVVDLYNDPQRYDLASPDGIASIIIREDLDKTSSINTVTAVVFDFRGYDTMGESFVLLTAISGAMVILRSVTPRGKKKQEEDAVHEKEEI